MRDINRLEKEKLFQWACDNYTEGRENRWFPSSDKHCSSYFEEGISADENCREYTFQTAGELRKELLAMWEDDAVMEQICTVVLVASMKNKPSEAVDDTISEETGYLEPYIYSF